MQNQLGLFVEINEKNYIFVVGMYDEDQNFKIIEKITTPSEGITRNKFANIEIANEIIKKNIEIIEKKLDHIFKDVIVVLGNFDCSCINISGFKRLNGSQVLKENISYILNSLKLAITENENQNTILHIFNSKSILDGINVENLPIGLFGNFYSHELSFFLINNNDLNNIKKVFNKNNLNITKFISKQFVEGSQLINNNKEIKKFFRIKIGQDVSSINFFENDSFRYCESFGYGTNIILKDVQKVCSLEKEIITNFLSNDNFNEKDLDKNELLEDHYFSKNNYRKIRKKLILEIIEARINEIVDIIFHENINISFFKKNSIKIYLTIEDFQIFKSFEKNFQLFFLKKNEYDISLINDFEADETITNVSNLAIYGWNKEAIPVVQAKNSLITRIFKSLFG
jgi:cell division protein FtsA